MVVGVPGPDWVEPVAQSLTRDGQWGITFRRTGAKTSEKPKTGSDETAISVSHAPNSLLPPSLLATADIRINMRPPGPRVLRAAIDLAAPCPARGGACPPAAAFKLRICRNEPELVTISWAANGTVPRSLVAQSRSPSGTS